MDLIQFMDDGSGNAFELYKSLLRLVNTWEMIYGLESNGLPRVRKVLDK